MRFLIYDREIEINERLIKIYESQFGLFNNRTISYLIETLGLTPDMPDKKIKAEIESAMKEDFEDAKIVKEILENKENKKLFG